MLVIYQGWINEIIQIWLDKYRDIILCDKWYHYSLRPFRLTAVVQR